MKKEKCKICGKLKNDHFKDKNDDSYYCYKKSPYGLRLNGPVCRFKTDEIKEDN